MVPVVGFVFDLTNAAISLARGNYVDATEHAIYAVPIIGLLYGVTQLGIALGEYALSSGMQASVAGARQELTELPVVHRVNWVSGPGGGNSFVAGTGVVTRATSRLSRQRK